jgi:ankyrin repeat protein
MSENILGQIADGRTDLVFEYLSAGHAATSADKGGVSLIQWCAYYGDVSAIRFLLSHGESLRSLGDNLDLNGAAFHGHWRLCQFLIEQGADVNKPLPESGEAPLHAALCTADRPAHDLVVKVLLAKGANPNCLTKAGLKPAVLCVTVGRRRKRPSTALRLSAPKKPSRCFWMRALSSMPRT